MNLLIIVDSKDRITGTPSNFIYQPKYVQQNGVKRFKVNKISCPYSYYTTMEQTFIYNLAGTNYNITFPAGNYTAATLGSTLQSVLNSYTAPFTTTVSYNSIKNEYSFTPSIGNIYFNFSSTNLTNNYFYYSVAYQAGIFSSFSETMLPISIFTSKYACTTSPTSNLYLKSSTLSMYYTSYFNGEKNTVISSIPINVNPLNWITFQSSTDIYFNYDNQAINNIDIQIVDDQNNPVDFRGINVLIEIEFTI